MLSKRKMKLGIALVAFVCVVGLVVFLALQETWNKNSLAQEASVFASSSTKDFKQGDSVFLSSYQDEEGLDYGYVAGFDWDGDMAFTLVSSEMFQSPIDAGIDDDTLVSSQPAGSAFLLCTLSLENINASLDPAFTRPSATVKGYRIELFSLQSEDGERRTLSYFDGAMEGSQGRLYELSPGETKSFRLGYFVYPEDVEEGLFYNIGISSEVRKYKVHLDIS